MGKFEELLGNVREATGPSTTLDIALLPLWEDFHPALKTYDERYKTELRDGSFSVWNETFSSSTPFPRFTASIDAALALVGKVLPDCRASLFTDGGGRGPCCGVMRGDEPVIANEHAPTLPLAIIAALLTALEQQP